MAEPWFDWIGQFDPQSHIFTGKSWAGDFGIVLTFDSNFTKAEAVITRLDPRRVDQPPTQQTEVYAVAPQLAPSLQAHEAGQLVIQEGDIIRPV